MIAQIDRYYLIARGWKIFSRLVSYALFEGRPLTTRGRWINPLVFAHFALGKRFPQIKSVDMPVFILGTGRSGTTVLGIVLSMHKEVGFLNEPKALWNAIYAEEDVIGSYSRGAARYRLGAEHASNVVKRSAHRLFGAYLAAVFSRRVVDKYPELIFRVPFVKAIFPDAKFLFLVRNGWDTCNSIKQWSDRLGKNEGNETHDWWGVNRRKWELLVDQLVPEHLDLVPHADEMRCWTNHIDMGAVEWIVTMREGLALLETHPADVMTIRFEELSRQPERLLRRVSGFLGLADDLVFLEYGKKTLHPVQKGGAVALHPAIVAPFNETMRRLGYA